MSEDNRSPHKAAVTRRLEPQVLWQPCSPRDNPKGVAYFANTFKNKPHYLQILQQAGVDLQKTVGEHL